MISEETIKNEPKQVKGHLTIGKTYLISNHSLCINDVQLTQHPPSSQLIFKNVDAKVEDFLKLLEEDFP
jgi:hypothetical protein